MCVCVCIPTYIHRYIDTHTGGTGRGRSSWSSNIDVCVCMYTGGPAGGGEAEVRGPQIRTDETRVGMSVHTHNVRLLLLLCSLHKSEQMKRASVGVHTHT